MKLFILAICSLILAVSSESENLKTNTVKDQKSDTSAFRQKLLTPLKRNVHQRCGMKEEVIKNMLKNDNKNYDYVDDHDDRHDDHHDDHHDYHHNDDHDDDHDDGYLRHDGRSRELYNEPNIWGYSRNGGLGRLVSHSYNGDPNVWGYLRNSEGRLRNMGSHSRHQGEGHMDHEDRLRKYMRRVYMRPGNKAHFRMIGPEIMGYRNMRNENMRHININAVHEPDHRGYLGQVHPRRMGINERYEVEERDLDAHRRRPMSHGHGLATLMLSPLGVVDRKHNAPNMYPHGV